MLTSLIRISHVAPANCQEARDCCPPGGSRKEAYLKGVGEYMLLSLPQQTFEKHVVVELELSSLSLHTFSSLSGILISHPNLLMNNSCPELFVCVCVCVGTTTWEIQVRVSFSGLCKLEQFSRNWFVTLIHETRYKCLSTCDFQIK